jgi:hypothetical protein
MKPRSEDDVYRELQQLLAVEPSPSFVARVRTSIASPAAAARPLSIYSVALSLTGMALLIAIVVLIGPAPNEPIASTPDRDRGADITLAPDAAPISPSARTPRRIARGRRDASSPRVPPDPSLQVMVSADDVQAFERLLRSTKNGTIELSFDETNRERTMAELTIAPITTEPLVIPELQGAVQ